MKDMEDNSVDSIVTDPPYGLSFMGKKWDYDVPSVEMWKECLRVLKPGGHLLAFAGTRTQHRMAVNIEDAGFEIRDMIAWVYGSGFPKSKSCLKPALEPITMARKPLIGTIVANVLEHETGGLNIEGCRIGDTVETWPSSRSYPLRTKDNNGESYGSKNAEKQQTQETPNGRFPANFIHDGSDEVVSLFPQTGKSSGGKAKAGKFKGNYGSFSGDNAGASVGGFGDSGSAARFFYCAKANKSEKGSDNIHPTVKPVALMKYLCRLVTPPKGVVLDPFMGSGTTGVAAKGEGFEFIGMEREGDYYDIASARINNTRSKREWI